MMITPPTTAADPGGQGSRAGIGVAGDEAPLATPALGEPDELAADARAAVGGVGDQHPEFALTGVQPLDSYDANDPLPGPGDRDLPGGDQPGHFGRRGAGRTVRPETLLGAVRP